MPAMSNRGQWAILRNEADINAGGVPFFTKEELETQINSPSTDWYGSTMKKALRNRNIIFRYAGNGKQPSYFVSFGYVTEGGLLKSGDLDYKNICV